MEKFNIIVKILQHLNHIILLDVSKECKEEVEVVLAATNDQSKTGKSPNESHGSHMIDGFL